MKDYSTDKRFQAGYILYKNKHNIKDDSMLREYIVKYNLDLLRELGRNNGIGYNKKYDNKVEVG